MPTSTDPIVTPPVIEPVVLPSGITPVPPQIQEPTPKPATPATPEAKTYSEVQLADMIEKARSEEKSKVFGKMDSLKEQNAKILSQAEESAKKLQEIEADRDALREGRSSEMKSVNAELGQLREQNVKLNSTVEAIADASAQRILEFEMKAYKAEKIHGSGLKLVELVAGETKTEIDASIQAALTREAELTAAVKENLRKEMASDLPTPISPDGSQGRGPTMLVTPENRQAVVRLKGDEYMKRRTELLNEARTKVRL